MKVFRFIYFLIALLAMPMSAYATVGAQQEASSEQIRLQENNAKRQFEQEKRMAKLEQKMEKWTKKFSKNKKVDLSDPVNKWAWMALGFAIIGVILGLTSLTAILSEIAFAAAVVCLVIWVLKYFGVF
jgi:Flp pilus assembly protein TadB